jgi:hypothetical protein
MVLQAGGVAGGLPRQVERWVQCKSPVSSLVHQRAG